MNKIERMKILKFCGLEESFAEPLNMDFYTKHATPAILNIVEQDGHKDRDVGIFLRLCEGGGWSKKGWIGSIEGYRCLGMVEGVEEPDEALGLALLNLIDSLNWDWIRG